MKAAAVSALTFAVTVGLGILGATVVVGLFGWRPVPVGSRGGYDPSAQLLPRGWLSLAPNQGNAGTLEFTWRGLELILGNYYVLILLAFIAATAVRESVTWNTRRHQCPPSCSTSTGR